METLTTAGRGRLRVRVLVLVLVDVAGAGFAQPLPNEVAPGDSISIRTVSGESFQGTLHAVLDDRVEIIASDGRITQIALSRVESVLSIDPATGDRGFFEDSASNRLVVMPTGFPMDAGEFHVASQEIVAVTGSYGINPWLSVWGGISIPGALSSLRASALIDNVGVSAGTFVGASWLDLSLGPFVLPYALVSYGSPANNVTVGSGFGMTFNEGFSIPAAVVAVGGKRALSATTALVTESWVVWGERSSFGGTQDAAITAVPTIVAPSLVFRIASSRLSWDIGGVVPLFINGPPGGAYTLATPVIPIPVLSITYRIQ